MKTGFQGCAGDAAATTSCRQWIKFDFLQFDERSGNCRVKLTGEVELAPRVGGLSVCGWTNVGFEPEVTDKYAAAIVDIASGGHGIAELTAISPDEIVLIFCSGGNVGNIKSHFAFGEYGLVSREPVDLNDLYDKVAIHYSGHLEITQSDAKSIADELRVYVVPG